MAVLKLEIDFEKARANARRTMKAMVPTDEDKIIIINVNARSIVADFLSTDDEIRLKAESI